MGCHRFRRAALGRLALALTLIAPALLGWGSAAAAILGRRAVPVAHWVAAWYSPPLPPTAVWSCNQVRTFSHQTVRQVVRLEAAGARVRIRLTNEIGLEPLPFGDVHVALSSPNGVTEHGTDRTVTFGGKSGGVIPRGGALVSDPVDLEVRRFQELAISVFYPGQVAPGGHIANLEISPSGDHAAESVWPQAGRSESPGVASGVEVATTTPQQVLVAFGDSITEGTCATQGTHRDYPEQLSVLLAAQRGSDQSWVIINSGISGNRLLRDGSGPKALAEPFSSWKASTTSAMPSSPEAMAGRSPPRTSSVPQSTRRRRVRVAEVADSRHIETSVRSHASERVSGQR